MKILDLDTYKHLRNATRTSNEFVLSTEVKNWYQISYELFKNSSLTTIGDFWRIVAYTYSWMPTIPNIKAHLMKAPDKLLENLHSIKNGNSTLLPSVLEELIPVVNNSLIGTSKVLHFIAPEIIPIIDRNVLRGWDIFFSKLYTDVSVIQLPNYQTALNLKHIPQYLIYKDILEKWAANSEKQFSIRDLEFEFFALGKKYSKKGNDKSVSNSLVR